MLIVSGTLLLWILNHSYMPLSFIDSLFTATSAVCVTGLVVVNTATDLSFYSKCLIVVLMQLGGLGVMTAFTSLFILRGSRVSLQHRYCLSSSLGLDGVSGVIRLLGHIVKMTFAIELFGALLLFGELLDYYESLDALGHAIFHSISAFCNAGFSTFPDNLVPFREDPSITLIIMLLIILGGIGFVPLMELVGIEYRNKRMSPCCKLVFSVTFLLIVIGCLALFLTEHIVWRHDVSVFQSFWDALFQSVSSRTAGFNTVDIGEISPVGSFVLILLMIIGASPGSTGGGIKTTTFGVLLLSLYSEILQREDIIFSSRKIPYSILRKAVSLVIVYMVTIFLSSFILGITEPYSFRQILFEVTSALGTVGLSTGITQGLSGLGKFLLILLMFWGRVGLIVFFYGVARRDEQRHISYIDTNVPIG